MRSVVGRLGIRGGRAVGALVALALAGSLATGAAAQTAPSGIDVSHYQGQIDWLSVATAGVNFAFVKATEGTTITDVTYPLNREGANGVGVRIGAYHFARPAGTTDAAIAASAIAQADDFVGFAQPAAGDLLPALDMEETGGLSVTQLTAWTQAWLDEVTARLGVRPIIYASPAFWKKYLGDTPIFAVAGDPLWIAHWTSAALPILPGGGWGGAGFAFWQWSDCQHVAGIEHCVDGDRFNGTSLASESIPAYPTGLPVASVAPSLEGTPQAGKELAALPGTWHGGKPVSFSYQWQSCAPPATCVPIPSATSETYTPNAEDGGHSLVVAVTATTAAGSAVAGSVPIVVAGSAKPTASAPTPVLLPTILGTAEVGQTLTSAAGTWKGSPTSFAYQWRRCDTTGLVCVAIPGAAAGDYSVTPDDIGAVLSLVVTATNKGGSRSSTSAGTAVVLAVPIPAATIGTGIAQAGQAGAVSLPDLSATATWQPGAVAAGSTVSVTAGPSKLALGGTSLTLGVSASAPLPWPIDVQYAAAPPDAVPGFLPGAGVWQPAPELSGPTLPDGQEFGAYRDAAGALHVLTRDPGRIALFAPGKWGDPRYVSSQRPSLTLVDDVTVARKPDGSALIRARITLDTQAHLYVSVLTPNGQALVPQQGNRVGWWLTGLPTKTIQTLQLRPRRLPDPSHRPGGTGVGGGQVRASARGARPLRPARALRGPDPAARRRLSRLPGNRLLVAEEEAGRAVVGERRRPDDRLDAGLGLESRTGAAHVGPDPAGADRVHEHARAVELPGKDAGQGVQGRLRDPVGGASAPHVGELAHPRGDVDDPPVPAVAHPGGECLGDAVGPERVRLERLAQPVDRDGERTVAGLAAFRDDPCVVHQYVDRAELGEARAALVARDVEFVGDHVEGLQPQLLGRLLCLRGVAPACHDAVAELAELPRGLEPEPAVGARDQRCPGAHRAPATRGRARPGITARTLRR